MSMYYESVKSIIQKNEENEEILANYYTEIVIKRLSETKKPVKNSFILLSDLKCHIQNYPFENTTLTLHTIHCTDENVRSSTYKHKDAHKSNQNDKIIENLKLKLFDLKMLNLRALILDLVDKDYSSDDQTFYKPEKWIYDVIQEIENTFQDTKYMEDYHIFFLNDCKRIFMGQNERFGWYGNLLVMDFLVYERWCNKHFCCKMNYFFDEIGTKFMPGRRMDHKVLQAIIDENN